MGGTERQFYAELLKRMGANPDSLPAQLDRSRWPEAKETLARLFKTRTRAEWCALLEGSDACFAPVLSMSEARRHPHNVARGAFVEVSGVAQPRPTPRFSRTDSRIQRPPARVGGSARHRRQPSRESETTWASQFPLSPRQCAARFVATRALARGVGSSASCSTR